MKVIEEHYGNTNETKSKIKDIMDVQTKKFWIEIVENRQ